VRCNLKLECSVLVELSKRKLCVQVLVEQTWQGGDRRNSEIRAQVMSEKEYLSEPEWLGRSRITSNMTSRSDVVVYGYTLWTVRNV
jgi:hypothetical protein